MMLPTFLKRISFALVATMAVISCGNTSSSNDSKGTVETLQQPTFVGSSVGVVKSASYSASFVMGATTPHRVGEEYIVGNAQGDQ